MPLYGAVKLRDTGDGDGELELSIGSLFLDLIRARRPDVVCWETPYTVEAWASQCIRQGRVQNGNSVLIQNQIASVLKYQCRRKEIPFLYVARQTVLKHFTGRSTWSSGKGAGDGRELGKQAVLNRCIQLGYLPKGTKHAKDDDRGDAIALWDYVVSTYGGRVPAKFEFFDEGKMVHQGNDE